MMYGHPETRYCLWTTAVVRHTGVKSLRTFTSDFVWWRVSCCSTLQLSWCVKWREETVFNTKTASTGTSVNWNAQFDADTIASTVSQRQHRIRGTSRDHLSCGRSPGVPLICVQEIFVLRCLARALVSCAVTPPVPRPHFPQSSFVPLVQTSFIFL